MFLIKKNCIAHNAARASTQVWIVQRSFYTICPIYKKNAFQVYFLIAFITGECL